ncbi:MAG TPA: SpoIID/LytB domain-containing protein, partial [Acidimicrobiales bacterium]|nr:SpoIID/LytB domain-containing protein [Acidimicrobiales bacterium]
NSASAPTVITTSRPLALTPFDGGSVTVVDRQRTYRGAIDASARDAAVRLVNQLSVDQYLRGMGEVRDPSWPAAALRSQAIAARTYALRAMDKAGELCDTQRCQVYLGQQAEYPAMDKAVAATAGQVLVFNKALASAVYSANAGGHSASREEGFGVGGDGYPYLRPAPYETKDAMPWTVSVALSDIAARLGHVPVSDVSVAGTGPSGRALAVTLAGPGGVRSVSGLEFARALGLRSTRFTVRMGVTDTAPAPPSAGTVLQAPPDEVGQAADAPTELHALAIDLPDRPRVERATSAAHSGPVSTVRALALLALTLVVVLGAGWRRRPRTS